MERSKLPVFTYLNTVKLAGSWTLRSKSCITVSGSIFYLDSDITLFLTMSTDSGIPGFQLGKCQVLLAVVLLPNLQQTLFGNCLLLLLNH